MTAHATASPSSMFDLLASSKSLVEFETTIEELSSKMALSIMAGISKSQSLKGVKLDVHSGPLYEVLPGIAVSSVESLQISHRDPDKRLWREVSKMLLCTRTLQSLTINDEHQSDETLGSLFLDLRHPACSLKELVLEDVFLSVAKTIILDVVTPMPLLRQLRLPIQANKSLRKLTLENTRFYSPSDVKVLWNLEGLHELVVSCPNYEIEAASVNRDYWAEFIRRNMDLRTVRMSGNNDSVDYAFMHGILDGVRQHKLIAKLTLTSCRMVGAFGVRLLHLLQEESPSLKELNCLHTTVESSCATLLAEGLCQNHFLTSLRFQDSEITARSATEIVEGLVVNVTLACLDFFGVTIIGQLEVPFCQTLAHVFRSNASLKKLYVSQVNLCIAGTLSEIVDSLKDNKTLMTLHFDECVLDNEALTFLGQALESTDIGLTHIGLGRFSDEQIEGRQVDNTNEEGMWAFLRSLKQMPNIRSVAFGGIIRATTEETHGFLLQVVRENKNICYLYDYASTVLNNASILRIESEIKYYLKLNQFGRRLLDSPNVLTSLWPMILAPMTTEPKNASPLFYFMREYFSRQQDNVPSQSQQPPHNKGQSGILDAAYRLKTSLHDTAGIVCPLDTRMTMAGRALRHCYILHSGHRQAMTGETLLGAFQSTLKHDDGMKHCIQ